MHLRATLPTAGSASSDPASVQQPSIGLVLLNLVSQHLCVSHGVQSQEWLGKARGESGLRLSNTIFGTGHLRRVARDEVEHGLG